MKVKNYEHISNKYYRRFKPLIHKDMDLIVIQHYLFAFILLCCSIGYISDLPKIINTCLMVTTALCVLSFVYTVYLKLKLNKQIKKNVEEIKEEQKSQFK